MPLEKLKTCLKKRKKNFITVMKETTISLLSIYLTRTAVSLVREISAVSLVKKGSFVSAKEIYTRSDLIHLKF
jgi:hypothetical protein